jgi:hypothetical protein
MKCRNTTSGPQTASIATQIVRSFGKVLLNTRTYELANFTGLEHRTTVYWSGGVTLVHRTLCHDFHHDFCQLLHAEERVINPRIQCIVVPISTILEYSHLPQIAYNELITNNFQTHKWKSSGQGWARWLPSVESNIKCNEWEFANIRQGVVHQTEEWDGYKFTTVK